MNDQNADYDAVRIGDKIRFDPRGGRRWWTVRDRDDRFIVATAQAPFHPKGELWYTVVDLTGWQNKRYNGAGNGVVRSSLNTLGGGWDTDDESLAEIIPALHSGEWELSHRRVVSVWSIEHTRVLPPVRHNHDAIGIYGNCPACGTVIPPAVSYGTQN